MILTDRVDVVGEGFVEIIVARAVFMDNISGKDSFGYEAAYEWLYICKIASTIIPDVNYQALSRCEIGKNVVDIPGTDG